VRVGSAANDDSEADIVIVGAGAAGCVLANRSSADPQRRVLLLEAGGEASSPWFRVPVGYRHTIGDPRFDWCFDSQPEPYLGGRVLRHPRGKVVGGSTAINGMVAIRGQAADYDEWAAMGLRGWGWRDVLPDFVRIESHVLGASHAHGAHGEWRIDAPRMHWSVLDAVRAAAVQCGIREVDDFNGADGDNEGVGPIHVNQHRGQRWSAADAFLAPARSRPNLRVVTGALADRVCFDDRDDPLRATGVRWIDAAGGAHVALARSCVVLCAGALASPAILMRSGIGPAGALSTLGITPRVDLPGVGANLHDHGQIALRWRLGAGARTLNAAMNSPVAKALMAARWAITRRGPLTMAPCQIGLFATSRADVARADLGWNVLAFSRPAFDAPFDPFPGLTMIVYPLRPTSRGHLELADADPRTPPRFTMNFLATDDDRRVSVDAMRLTRRIMQAPALAPLQPQEQWPGATVADDDDAALLAALKDKLGTIYHPVGTARMGPDGDALAVTDDRLRVRSTRNLRVIDASVMPSIVSGNTATPTVMIGEKGVRMVAEDRAGRSP
jgi:choline dehydrogenase